MSNNHEKFKRTMKIAGLILLAIGIVFIVIGAADFAHTFKSKEIPEKFWAFFVGFPLFAFGAMCTMIGFHREIVRYMKDETMPVAKEAAQELKAALTEDGAKKPDGAESEERAEGAENAEGEEEKKQ